MLDWSAISSTRSRVTVAGAVLGDFKSRVNGVGPQVGHMFEMRGGQAYFNAQGLLGIRLKDTARPVGMDGSHW